MGRQVPDDIPRLGQASVHLDGSLALNHPCQPNVDVSARVQPPSFPRPRLVSWFSFFSTRPSEPTNPWIGKKETWRACLSLGCTQSMPLPSRPLSNKSIPSILFFPNQPSHVLDFPSFPFIYSITHTLYPAHLSLFATTPRHGLRPITTSAITIHFRVPITNISQEEKTSVSSTSR